MLGSALITAGAVSARPSGPGDLIATGESISALATVGAAGVVTAAMVAGGILRRTAAGEAFTDTFPTAQQIVDALKGNDPLAKIPDGSCFRFIYINGVAFAMTFAAGVGVVLGTDVNIAASLVREYLVEILNSTTGSTAVCNTTNANAIVTLQSPVPLGRITPGQLVSGTGITAGSVVSGVNLGDQTNRGGTDMIYRITLDQVGASVQTGVTLSFVPRVRFTGLRTGTA